jgi:hypothetical protein
MPGGRPELEWSLGGGHRETYLLSIVYAVFTGIFLAGQDDRKDEKGCVGRVAAWNLKRMMGNESLKFQRISRWRMGKTEATTGEK